MRVSAQRDFLTEIAMKQPRRQVIEAGKFTKEKFHSHGKNALAGIAARINVCKIRSKIDCILNILTSLCIYEKTYTSFFI